MLRERERERERGHANDRERERAREREREAARACRGREGTRTLERVHVEGTEREDRGFKLQAPNERGERERD